MKGCPAGQCADLTNQIRHRHLTGMGDLFQAVPKGILKGDARIVTVETD